MSESEEEGQRQKGHWASDGQKIKIRVLEGKEE